MTNPGSADLITQIFTALRDGGLSVDSDALRQALGQTGGGTGPSVGSVSSSRDTNVAAIIVQYNQSVATVADTSRTNRYFVEIPANGAPETPATPTASRSPFATTCILGIRNLAFAQRVVLLGSPPGVPVSMLIRSIAADIQQLLMTTDTGMRPSPLPILEYSPADDQMGKADAQVFDIERHILSLQTPTILIFPQATREHLGWDLVTLARIAQERSHYIIASTDIEATPFQLRAEEQHFWRPLTHNEIYEPAFLEQSLLEGLADHQSRLPLLLRRSFHATEDVVPGCTFRTIAHELRSPVNIAALIQRLMALRVDATASEIHTCIEEASRYDLLTALRQWYQGLDRRAQLLVVGLSLFDRCQETQLFAALQQLMRDVWQARDTLTPILDRLDFIELRSFFHFVETGPYSVRVEGVLSQQRRLLFSIAIESHRRHLQLALPWLVELIKQSVTPGAAKQELYSVDSQRVHLRSTLGEALTDISLLAFDIAQPALLLLVADKRDVMHVVLARTLALWETRGQGAQLLQLLTQWQRDPQHINLVRVLLAQQYGTTHEDAEMLLRAASLLIVTYAIRASKPSAVNAGYWDLLNQLSGGVNERGRHYLADYTLRMLLPQHIGQCGQLLRTLILCAELRSVVCKRLISLYSTCPKDVVQLLKIWFNEGVASKSAHTSNHVVQQGEELLLGVVLVISAIPRGDGAGSLSPQTIQRIEQRALQCVQHPSIRMTILTTILRNAWQHAHALQAILAEVQEAEHTQVIHLLTEGYIEQRRSLDRNEHADIVRLIDGEPVPLWWDERQRPRTASETFLSSLLTKSDDQHLQQLAFQAMLRFTERFDAKAEQELAQAVIDMQREQERQQRRRVGAVTQPFWEAVPDPALSQQPASPLVEDVRDFYRTHLVPLLAVREAPHYRDLVYKLLPQVLAYHRQHPELLELRLTLWEKGGDATLATFTRCMREAIRLAPLHYWAIREVGASTLITALRELWRENVLQEMYSDTLMRILVFAAVVCILFLGALVWWR